MVQATICNLWTAGSNLTAGIKGCFLGMGIQQASHFNWLAWLPIITYKYNGGPYPWLKIQHSLLERSGQLVNVIAAVD